MCEKRMLVLITGETGSGKSACLRLLGSRLDPNTYLFNYVANSSLPRNFIVKALMIIDIKSPLKQTTSHSLTQICNIPSTITILQRYRFPCCVKINIALYGSGNVHILALAGYIPQHFPRYAQLALAAVNIARHGIPIDPARATPAPAGNRDTGE